MSQLYQEITLNDIGVMAKASFVMTAGTVYKQDGKELVWESPRH